MILGTGCGGSWMGGVIWGGTGTGFTKKKKFSWDINHKKMFCNKPAVGGTFTGATATGGTLWMKLNIIKWIKLCEFFLANLILVE